MERLKNMSLRRAFFLLTFCGLVTAVTLASLLWGGCRLVSSQYPLGGVIISIDGVMTPLPQPTPEQLRLLNVLDILSLLGWVVFPVAGLGVAGTLFYRWKLKEPIRILMEGTRRIQTHDLDFTLPTPSADEQTIDRLESYTLRMEQYVEAMSSIQRIEQMPVRINEVTASRIYRSS